MYIRIKPDLGNSDRFIPVEIRCVTDQPEGFIPLSNISNAYDQMPNGMFIWEFVQQHLSLEPSWILEVDSSLQFDLRFDELKAYKIKLLKKQTYDYVVKYLPEWKQIKWMEYARIYEKLQAEETLTNREQLTYNAIVAAGPSAAEIYAIVLAMINWIQSCISINDAKEYIILNATTVDQISSIDISCQYPELAGT